MAKKERAKGRGPRIRQEEVDRMVALYMEGKSLKAIGKAVGRSWQTVQKYTIKELQEREGRNLRLEALRGALAEHYRDLVQALRGLPDLVKSLGDGSYQSAPGWQPPAPDLRSRLLLDALRSSHVTDSPIWSWWDEWNKAATSYDEARQVLRSKIATRMTALERLLPKGSGRLENALAEVLFLRAMSIAREGSLYDPSMLLVRPMPAEEPQLDAVPEQLWLGQSTLLAEGQTMGKLKERLTKVMEQEMPEWEEVKRLAQLRRQMTETEASIAEEVEVLSLRRVFPGRCRLCPV